MRDRSSVSVIIPALDEARSIAKVLDAIPDWVDEVIVADNGSSDGTAGVAEAHGATVVHEARRGYGSACLKGIASLRHPEVVVFLDADFSDHPEQMDRLVDPILRGEVDMVIGSRVRGRAERGALTPQARFGNRLACLLLRLFWGVRYTDLGPFRAIRYSTLQRLGMRDPDYGWTVEMQIKGALHGVPATEVPVDYRKRIGRSKVSGTLRGVIGAGYKILSTLFISALKFYGSGGNVDASNERLILFTRYPEPGAAKTRLIPALGPDGAADLQRAMTEHAVEVARTFARAAIEIRYTGSERVAMADWLGPDLRYAAQCEGDLGRRMGEALQVAFAEQVSRAVITGTDSPEICPAVLRGAFDALKRHDIVVGPATDGGYYLIGMRREAAARALPSIFDGIEWGSETVGNATLNRVREGGLDAFLLAPLDDVDRPEDLDAWERAQADRERAPGRPELSVIIPTLNEAADIQAALTAAFTAGGVEVIVSDGGSDDATCAIAEEHGARVVEGRRGRGAQMNLGSAKALAEVLLFVHADTLLPERFEQTVLQTLSRPTVAAGAFAFDTTDRSFTMRVIAFLVNLRSRWLHLPYGDQALFVRKDLFREVGGFRDLPIMEDFEFVRRIAKRGRVVTANAKVTTCARRWQALGPVRTTIVNQFVLIMYHLRFPLDKIAAFYHREMRKP